MKALLRIPGFRPLLVAVTLSVLADSLLLLSIGIWVKTLTGSSSAAGIVMLVMLLPALAAPLLGAWIDRVPRRPFLVGVNVGSALVMLPLLLVNDSGHIWLVYICSLLYGLSFPLFSAGNTALVKELVPFDELGNANGALESTRQGLRMVGPLVGAALFASVGPHVVVGLAAAGFVAAALVLLRVRVTEQPPAPAGESWRVELVAGARALWDNRLLRPITIATAVALAGAGVFEPAIYSIVDEGLGQQPAFVSVIVFAQGIGAVLGGFLAPRLIARLGERMAFSVALAVAGVAVAAFVMPTVPSVLVGAAVFGVSFSCVVVAMQTALQRTTPEHLIGRVTTVLGAAITAPQTLGIAVAAGLLAAVGFRPLLTGTMVVIVATALVMLATSRVRPPVRGQAQPERDVVL